LTTPRVRDFLVTSARAATFGRYPISLMTSSTRSRVVGFTLGWSFRTLETVWCETPAKRATSAIRGARPSALAEAALGWAVDPFWTDKGADSGKAMVEVPSSR